MAVNYIKRTPIGNVSTRFFQLSRVGSRMVISSTQSARTPFSSSSFSSFPTVTPTRRSLFTPQISSISRVEIRRSFASGPVRTTQGDEIVAELEELYFTARDEFEIAAEETTSNTVYAADDRVAAQEAFQALRTAYDTVIDPANPVPELTLGGKDEAKIPASIELRRSVAEEVRSRIGHRIRELENAVKNLEILANEMH